MTKKQKQYQVIYSIIKQELMADLFDTKSETIIKQDLKKLVNKYNKQNEDSQIVQIQIHSVEEVTNH